jgi:glycine dehydrogenase subunit 1
MMVLNRYIPMTEDDRNQMLETIGKKEIAELFSDIPEAARIENLDLEPGKSEMEIRRLVRGLTATNKSADDLVCFLGAGAYDHEIPAVIDQITGRSEFYTAYTPYQPEIAQGTLQTIFEYQSMICELTGMYASNASLYDGHTAAVEALLMADASSKKTNKVLVSQTVNPEIREVIASYLHFRNVEMVEVKMKDGVTDREDLEERLAEGAYSGFLAQSPNFFGIVEDLGALTEMAHAHKALSIAYVNPIGLGLLEAPGKLGVDIVVGEGQPLGLPLNYGGPYLGFIATTKKLVRKLPGRICGQSVDQDGKRAFVLTLQAREQHIRREKATSNICSNQGLMVVRAALYMSLMGKNGIAEVAEQSYHKAHYAYKRLTALEGISPVFDGPFFNEFVIRFDRPVNEINEKLAEAGYLGGFDLEPFYGMKGAMLLCVTEKRTREEIDGLVSALEGIL